MLIYMMYCAINEAFNNDNMNIIDNNNNEYNNTHYIYSKYNKYIRDKQQQPSKEAASFLTQQRNINTSGTSINDLKYLKIYIKEKTQKPRPKISLIGENKEIDQVIFTSLRPEEQKRLAKTTEVGR